jgi:hypothetical protein
MKSQLQLPTLESFTRQEIRLITDLLKKERHRMCVDVQMYKMGWDYPHYVNANRATELINDILEKIERIEG